MIDKHWNPKSHWDDHPNWRPEDWRYEVANNNTRESYIDWVNNNIEQSLDELQACPFCLNTDVEVWNDDTAGDSNNWTVVCSVKKGGCGCCSGYGRTSTKARETWNTRKVKS